MILDPKMIILAMPQTDMARTVLLAPARQAQMGLCGGQQQPDRARCGMADPKMGSEMMILDPKMIILAMLQVRSGKVSSC